MVENFVFFIPYHYSLNKKCILFFFSSQLKKDVFLNFWKYNLVKLLFHFFGFYEEMKIKFKIIWVFYKSF